MSLEMKLFISIDVKENVLEHFGYYFIYNILIIILCLL